MKPYLVSAPWEVAQPGDDPSCRHPDIESPYVLSYRPAEEFMHCRVCARVLVRKFVGYPKPVWPEAGTDQEAVG